MLAALRELRAAIDQALALLERLRPAVAAWEAGQAPVAPSPNGATADPDAELTPQDVAGPAAELGPAAVALRQRPCRGCDGLFSPKTPQERFCSPACKKRVQAERRVARQRAAGAPGRGRKRAGSTTPPRPEALASAPPAPERRALPNGPATNGQDRPRCSICGASIDAGAEVCSDACGAVLRKIHPPLPTETRP
jgi:predicted nucleic acid-binding Zn ribbon protein